MSKKLSRRPSRVAAPLLEPLEQRALLTTVINNGVQMGTIDERLPVGGLKAVPSVNGSVGRAGGDGQPGFQITLSFTGGLTASQQAIFAQAAAKWESILTGDIADNDETEYGYIDDVMIRASGAAYDGPKGVLGFASPEYYRQGTYLPITGTMTFDTADLPDLEAAGLLDEVIVHEMGHVLGIGTIWPQKFLITGAGGTDPRFTGTRATAEYNALAGLTSSTGVPVANAGGAGTQDVHWREQGLGGTGLGNELMTGIINSQQSDPLSRISAASSIDLGYPRVNVDAADLYTIPTNPGNGGGGDFTAVNPLPMVGALTASSSSVAAGSSFTLNLGSAADNGSVGSISFYRESNGIAGLESTGTVVSDALVVTNAGGGNLAVTVSTVGLAPGTYTFYARATDNFGALSAAVATNVTVVAAPGTPSAPVLLASQDTGASGSDGVTRLNVLTFTGTATAGATVTLKSGSTVIGSGVADSAGNYSVTTGTLADGSYAVTAAASNVAGTSAASAATTIRVDTVRPIVVATHYDRDVTQAVTFTLSESLGAPPAAANFVLMNLTTGATVAISGVVVGNGGTTLMVQPAALLPDGNYQLTLTASAAADLAGNSLAADAVVSFRQLAGDANDDGTVNFSDLVILARNYNATGKTFSQGNFNYSGDGVVNFADLVILAQNYNHVLAAMLAAPTLAVSSTTNTSSSMTKTTSTRGGNAAAVIS